MLDKLYMYIMCRFATGKNVSCLPVGNNILALSKPSPPPPQYKVRWSALKQILECATQSHSWR